MVTIIDGARSSNSRVAGIYLAVLVVALIIVAAGTAMWLSTDNITMTGRPRLSSWTRSTNSRRRSISKRRC